MQDPFPEWEKVIPSLEGILKKTKIVIVAPVGHEQGHGLNELGRQEARFIAMTIKDWLALNDPTLDREGSIKVLYADTHCGTGTGETVAECLNAEPAAVHWLKPNEPHEALQAVEKPEELQRQILDYSSACSNLILVTDLAVPIGLVLAFTSEATGMKVVNCFNPEEQYVGAFTLVYMQHPVEACPK